MLNELPKLVHNLKKRVGRGKASNEGKTSGRGMKGQRARAKVRAGFEGGQMRLIKRLPKVRGKGFSGIDKKIGIVNLAQLENVFEAKEKVTLNELKERGLVKKSAKQIKVLGMGTLTKALVFDERIIFSKKAEEKLAKNKLAPKKS